MGFLGLWGKTPDTSCDGVQYPPVDPAYYEREAAEKKAARLDEEVAKNSTDAMWEVREPLLMFIMEHRSLNVGRIYDALAALDRLASNQDQVQS